MGLLKGLTDHTQPGSFTHRIRLRRFRLFRNLMAKVPRPWRMLDVGGEARFWSQMAFLPPSGCEIVLLNLDVTGESLPPRMTAVSADARDMSQFATGEFDVAFSNSVIEHVGGRADQQRMAREIMRVARRYFVQTPCFEFPFEPHFLLPGIHWLPEDLRIRVVQRLRPGWYGSGVRTRADAEDVVRSIQLLRRAEVLQIFPGARLAVERLALLPKSSIAFGGWEDWAAPSPTPRPT